MGLRNFIDCFIRPLNLKEKALGDLRTMKKKNCFGKNNHQKFQELRVLKDARSDSMTSNFIFHYDVEDSSAASSSSFSSKSISSTDSLTLPILFFSQTTRMRYSSNIKKYIFFKLKIFLNTSFFSFVYFLMSVVLKDEPYS
jgi:hypothetical protein